MCFKTFSKWFKKRLRHLFVLGIQPKHNILPDSVQKSLKNKRIRAAFNRVNFTCDFDGAGSHLSAGASILKLTPQLSRCYVSHVRSCHRSSLLLYPCLHFSLLLNTSLLNLNKAGSPEQTHLTLMASRGANEP